MYRSISFLESEWPCLSPILLSNDYDLLQPISMDALVYVYTASSSLGNRPWNPYPCSFASKPWSGTLSCALEKSKNAAYLAFPHRLLCRAISYKFVARATHSINLRKPAFCNGNRLFSSHMEDIRLAMPFVRQCGIY